MTKSSKGDGYLALSMIFVPMITIYFFPILHFIILRIYLCCRANPTPQKLDDTEEQKEPNPNDQLEMTSEVYDKELFKDRSLRRIYSMHFNGWAWFWILYFVITAGSEDYEQNYPATRKIGNIYGYFNIPVLALYMYIETFFCWEWNYLGTIMEEKTCRTYIKELTEARPTVTATVTAWHPEIRFRTVPYQIGGNTYYRTESYTEKVVDYSESRVFNFARWEDISPISENISLESSKLTRIVMLKCVNFGDDETQAEFNQLMSALEETVRGLNPGSKIDCEKEDGVPGFKDKFLAYWENQQPKWWISRRVFVIASFLLLTWVYRILFAATSQKAHFRIIKKIYVR